MPNDRIRFQASDVIPRAQKDGSWNFLFESGEDSAKEAALLCLLRKRNLTVEVYETPEPEQEPI